MGEPNLLDPAPPADPAPTPEPTPTPDPAPPAEPAFSLPENWKDSLAEDLKGDPSLDVIKDFEGLVKTYVHSQRMLGSDKIHLPSKHDDGSELRGVLHKLGLPTELDNYDLGVEAENKEMFDAFKNKAHELGVLPSQAGEMFKHF